MAAGCSKLPSGPGGNFSRCSSSVWGKGKYPAGCCVPWKAEADDGRLSPGARAVPMVRGVTAGFQPEDGHLVCLVPHLQSKVMQGLQQEGVEAVIEQLEVQLISISPNKCCQCASQGIRKSLGDHLAAAGCLVEWFRQ
jgi:hypothetical protein